MIFSIIQKSQLEGTLRLDAEFYHPEKMKAIEKLLELGISKVSENFKNVKEIFSPVRHQLTTKPASLFDLSDVSFFLLDEGKKVNDSSEIGSVKKIFRQNDVLISRLRPYLKEVTFVGFDNTQKLASTEFIVLRRKKDSKFSPQVLFAFLITDEIQKILFWSQGGTEHPRFPEELLLDLNFPKLSKKDTGSIINNVNSAYRSYFSSKSLYQQAEDLFLEELGLKDFQLGDDLSYVVNFSDTESASRLDAEYFQPRYERIKSKVRNFEFKKLGDIVSIKKGIEPGSEIYQEEGIPFVRVSNISKSGIKDDNQQYLSQEDYNRFKDNFEPKAGEILLTKDATPGIAYYLDDQMKGIISGGILRLKTKIEIKPEYLVLTINSIVGQMQAEQDTGGSIIVHWRPEQINDILIPILPKPTQQKIADLVRQSHAARQKAKQLLEQAKQKVEDLIEKGNK